MNKLERWTLYAIVALAILMVASCGLMNPQQQAEALAALDSMLAAGSISPEQHIALREGILSASTSNWWQQIVGTVVAAGLAYVGVQVRRGPVATPEERVIRTTAKKSGDQP